LYKCIKLITVMGCNWLWPNELSYLVEDGLFKERRL
jgi:hypothetical protein